MSINKEAWAALLDKGLRLTEQRRRILERLSSSRGHWTADSIHRSLRREFPRMGRATVFRALKLFSSLGLVERTSSQSPRGRFEEGGKAHHDHMTCLRCGSVLEFHRPEIERLQREEARRRGFQLVRHALELVGYCRSCRKGSRA